MIVSAREAALVLGMSERTIRRWIKTGDLAAVKRGGEFHIDRDELLQVANRKGASSRLDHDAELAAMTAIVTALSPLEQPGVDRVLRWAVDRFDAAVPT
jgi:excisionase family DNA binding protein